MKRSYVPKYGHACCPHCKSEFDLVAAKPTFLEKAPYNDIVVYIMCRLGEEVAAMVVLHEGHECSERELQLFVSARVAAFKVPKKVLFVEELPKGATGKLQRIGLAQRIGLGFGSFVQGEF